MTQKTTTALVGTDAAGIVPLRRARLKGWMRTVGMLPVLVILCILIQAGTFYLDGEGRFLSGQNLSIVLQQAAINTVLGAGMTFVILTGGDRKSTRLNSSHYALSRMPSSA